MNDTTKALETYDRLFNVLDQVKDVLKAGDFSALQQITDRQNKLFALLDAQHLIKPLDPRRIKILGQMAGQNQRYLTAAKAGIHAAANRRATVRNTRAVSKTYDRKGQRLKLENLPDSFEQRS